jgi:glycosyltransferase involved in cell wall biosynthesis
MADDLPTSELAASANGLCASVVVCSYNRARHLERALRSLARQTVPADTYEIIVVDDHSEDETPDVCRRLEQEVSNLRCIRNERNLGLPRSRNRSIRAARGASIVFVDDDCIARPDWLEHMVNTLATEPLVAGAMAPPAGGRFWQMCHHVAQFHAVLPGRRAGEADWLANGNAGYSRLLLEELEGFDPGKPIGADTDLVLRARRAG